MRTRYDYEGERSSDVGAVDFSDDPGYTKQEFKEECDINTIMRKYRATGTVPGNTRVGRYGDFASVGDFHAAQNMVIQAQAQFAAMPSEVRDRFKNDPALFLEFVHDKKNYEEARKLGLLDKEAKPKSVPEVAPAAPAAGSGAPVVPTP